MQITTMSSSSAAAAGGLKICFNAHCKEALTEQTRRKGWRLRSGEFAELCDRCHSTFDQGNFCETYHLDAAGWRKCESCGKRIHCGCIVSVPAYMLLDVGGVECLGCARKAYSAVPTQVCSPSVVLSPLVLEKSKECTIKNWNQGSGSFPGQWRHPSNIWNSSTIQSDLHQRLSYEFDRPSNSEKLLAGASSSISLQEKKPEGLPGRIGLSGLNHVPRNRYGNNCPTSTRKGMMSDASASSSKVNFETCQSSSGKSSSSIIPVGESTSLLISLTTPLSSLNDISDPIRATTNHPQHKAIPSPFSKQNYPNPINSSHSGESQAQTCNGRGRLDPRAHSHLLPRYWPRITDQELQQISGDSNSVVTPLFEKMLSASDAGRIGRLVLPKKCAEVYFPMISQPEGLPLKMQDASGKEWVFQFRFWPNNNSRMYVLEGVTPCIQSMQLQAGDTVVSAVTFSRIDPEGKFLMGFRKSSTSSCTEQENQGAKAGNGSSASSDVKNNAMDFIANLPLRPHKGSIESKNQTERTDKESWSMNDKAGFIQKDGHLPVVSYIPSKRKSSTLGSKSKRLRIENEDSIELTLTWEEAQVLIRSAHDDFSSVSSVSVEGHQFEEFEEGPVLGLPTYFGKNQDGDINNRWVQCENCSKWRRLPLDALLHHRWTCSDNKWDPERSSCSAPQEISMETRHLLPMKCGSSKKSKLKFEDENFEVSDGLDTLANLAILGENKSHSVSSQPTTKHPRHRPGCTCIVCIQPPSGKGPKHKQTCTCNVCLTVKRRFQTLMLRREKRQSEKESENGETPTKQQNCTQPAQVLPQTPPSPSACIIHNAGLGNSPPILNPNNGLVDDEFERKRATPSPIKTQIDLNIQPEREEEPSPVDVPGSMIVAFQNDLD
ncbi:B3 domain-containing protein Os07g0563300-like [Phalaenopsis equestris]|uniref:B3 domain-containing protein Os07g0563300-like n=1 Tax=Phalaenopsis equestris TaxID=78828 RepID=UPI0009E44E56|nr:B3 domain-containing protein Os07g0563300-like [Phalaenopsis equestris]